MVLSFEFTGCVPCLAPVPDEVKLAEKHAGRPHVALGVNRERTGYWPHNGRGLEMTWPQFSKRKGGGQVLRMQEFERLLECPLAEADRK